MQPQTLLDHKGNPINFGYQASRPTWRRNNDALDRSPITISEERVLSHGNRLELLATLRDLERNNPIAKSIVQVFTSNLGTTVYRGAGQNEQYNEVREKLFKKYFRACEITGLGLTKVLNHIITDLLLAGEVFVLLTRGGSFQLIPSERIASNTDSTDRKENEVEGLVLNKFGRVIEYRINQIVDGAIDYKVGSYIPASNIIHISNNIRIGQLRGTPMLAPATKTLEDIHEVQTAYTAKVKTSSALTGFITSNQPYSARWDGNEFGEEPMRSNYKKLYSGSLLILENGESVQTIQGGNIDGVDKFMTQLISFACSSVGITVENLVGWSNASFSSSKATRAVTNHRFGQIREMIEETFLRRLAKWRTYKWENNEELSVNEELRDEFYYQWSSSPTLDRRQDAQTDAIMLEKNLASPSTIFTNNGLDFESEVEKMKRDAELIAGINPVQNEIGSQENGPSIKEVIDAYSAGVRGGTITPQQDDENHFRNLLGLPTATEPVEKAWEKDGGARRPITLKSQDAFEANETAEAETINEDEEEDLEPEELEALEQEINLEETYNDYPQSASNNAKRAIEYKEKNGSDCGTTVGWTRARQLAEKQKISRETIARMASFKRHQENKDVPYSEGCGGIMWDAWGGTSGIEWAIRKLAEIDGK